ncbi:acyl-CoA carboxylase subunit epsilon [Zafaria sp. Z1313]|uniref:acyl-CoA carboxylase subunit epsilon n=1 Tax=unclassified Zafaria TaxID=2828765 RepID=UPI002E790750|nr:acyl-CoA carboxylase subunit epsilon [Zafaria sp. J156]MEE1619992.1 acyl-CoA carboxylase subunit epsilon [Zafaria sp. J156]
MQHGNGTTDAPEQPLLRVVKGEPTPEELAALTAVVLGLGADDAPGDAPAPGRRERLRGQVRRGRQLPAMPGAWRSGRF